MNPSHIIKKAILSEKGYKLMERGAYTFLVDNRATKAEIAKKVSIQFGVKVKKVNVSSFSPKQKRIGQSRRFTLVGGGKKATVYLVAGESIGMLSPKTEAKKSSKKGKEDKKPEKESQSKNEK